MMKPVAVFILHLLLGAVTGSVAAAQGTGAPVIGDLLLGRTERCVATLIEPDVALTAAHCLAVTSGREIRLPSSVRFAPATGGGEIPAFVFSFHPRFAAGAPPDVQGISADLALVRLTRPVPGVPGIEIGAALRTGETVLIRRSGQGDAACRVVDAGVTVAVLDCAVGPGDSGAPIFRIRDGRPVLAGIISARNGAGGQGRSVAVEVSHDLPAMRARLPLAVQK